MDPVRPPDAVVTERLLYDSDTEEEEMQWEGINQALEESKNTALVEERRTLATFVLRLMDRIFSPNLIKGAYEKATCTILRRHLNDCVDSGRSPVVAQRQLSRMVSLWKKTRDEETVVNILKQIMVVR